MPRQQPLLCHLPYTRLKQGDRSGSLWCNPCYLLSGCLLCTYYVLGPWQAGSGVVAENRTEPLVPDSLKAAPSWRPLGSCSVVFCWNPQVPECTGASPPGAGSSPMAQGLQYSQSVAPCSSNSVSVCLPFVLPLSLGWPESRPARSYRLHDPFLSPGRPHLAPPQNVTLLSRNFSVYLTWLAGLGNPQDVTYFVAYQR